MPLTRSLDFLESRILSAVRQSEEHVFRRGRRRSHLKQRSPETLKCESDVCVSIKGKFCHPH